MKEIYIKTGDNMQKRMSIPIQRNYNEIWKDFQISFFKDYTKEKWLNELLDINSFTYELCKDDVERLFLSTGGYFGVLDFEGCYLLAKKVLKKQLLKNIHKKRICFFEKNVLTNQDVYIKIVQRLTNLIYNLFDEKRKNNVINLQIWILDKIYENYEIDFNVEDIKKIAYKKPEELISSIFLLLNNFELDADELIEICEKYNIDKSNFNNYYFSEQFRFLRKQSNNQVFIDFSEEEREVS
ncbi:hypothetical protein [Aliarcobacter cryaerophilus]|uniref:hypothetical protein n=1 Tax=Aliarcobacter cryaerophilus TaxID=28198 RepID=UPI0021B39CD7|nr:hypothetical protein [Aliarcobacter cryaerophilus]